MELHIHPSDPKAAAYVRNDGEVKWHLNDLDVAIVEELNPEGAMEVQNLRALGMGWAWYVNDLSKYLPDAEALADMTPADDVEDMESRRSSCSFKVCVLEVRRLDKFAAAREYFDPGKGSTRLPTPTLPDCSPASSHSVCVRSVFWYSELDPVPETIRAVAARCRARAYASRGGVRPVVVLRGEGVPAHAQAREAHVQENGGVEEKSSASAREAPLLKSRGECGAAPTTLEQSLSHVSPGKGRGWMEDDERAPGIEELEESDTMSEESFATAVSQGHRTEEEDTLTFEVSMVQLGWQNEEKFSDRWVKVADQPEVRVMQLTKREEPPEAEEEEGSKNGDREKKPKMVYCVTGLPISKQQELVEASFQLRARLLEMNAFTFANVDLEAIPVDVAYVTALSQQEVPDYFAGPAMAKTVTQESRVVFGPEQAEWKEAILAELESFAKLGVYEVVTLKEIRGAEILPGRLVLVAKPNPEGAKGKKKARIVVCGNFQTVHPDEMTSSKTPSYPMLRMLLSLASYKGWPIESWDVSMRPLKVIEKLGLLPEGTIWKLKKALYGLRTSPLAWEVERDNSLAELQWEIDGSWYGLTPAKGNPCLWAVVQLQAEKGPASQATRHGGKSLLTRSIGVQTEGQDKPLELLGGLVTYVDDLLLAMPEVHMQPIIRLLLKKYVMKQLGCLPSGPQKRDVQIGFLGCLTTRDSSGTVLCDQEKYILHCMHENSFVGESQTVTLKPRHHLPVVDEKLPDEVLPEAEKRKHVSDCQRYIGQLMWLATRTRPDISALLGICASMMVRTPKAVAAHLVDLWRFVWSSRFDVMSTLSPEKGLVVDCLADLRGDSHGSKIASQICQRGQSAKEEQGTPEIPCFHIHSYTDASFATSQGRSRSGYMICFVPEPQGGDEWLAGKPSRGLQP